MNKNSRESKIVTIAPAHIGSPNKMFNAMADPITSCMSEPIMANSVIIHRMYLVLVENYSAHSLARFLYVTIPILAAIDW